MKQMLVGFVALALLMVAECPAGGNKGGNKNTNFNVFCTFDSGDEISGQITIDTAGDVSYASLDIYYPFNSLFGVYFLDAPTTSTNAAGDVEIIVSGLGPGGYPAEVVLTLPVTSLKKYAGGDVIATDSYWGYGSYYDYLATGSISMAP